MTSKLTALRPSRPIIITVQGLSSPAPGTRQFNGVGAAAPSRTTKTIPVCALYRTHTIFERYLLLLGDEVDGVLNGTYLLGYVVLNLDLITDAHTN